MEDKIWYNIKVYTPYPIPEGFIIVDSITAFKKHSKTINKSINLFNSEIEWDNMWDLELAEQKIHAGEKLFLITQKESKTWRGKTLTSVEPLGHVWFNEDYLHYMFMSTKRKPGTTVKFLKACFNFVPYNQVNLYCDKWNYRAQKFFEKVGAEEISSYL